MNMLKTCLHWTHRVFWYTVAGLIIASAIAVSLARIFIPDVKVYREQIEHIASKFLGQDVHIKSMDARLSGFTPTLLFRDVSLLDDKGKHEIIHFSEARLGLDVWRSVSNGKLIPRTLTLYGVNLGITRRKNRTLVLRGLELKKLEQQIKTDPETIDTESSELARWLFERSTVALKHSTVVWRDALHGDKVLRFDDVNLDIRNDGKHHQFSGAVNLPSRMGVSLSLAFDFEGNILNPAEWQGSFYTRGSLLKIANWGSNPRFNNATLEKGLLDMQLWGHWQGGRVTALSSDLNARDVSLKIAGRRDMVQLKHISGLFDWRQQDNGWRLGVSNFNFSGKSGQWPTSNMLVNYTKRQDSPATLDAYGSYLQIADSVGILEDLKLLSPELQKTLDQLTPNGELTNLYVHYQAADKNKPDYRLSSHFKDLTISAHKNFPGFQGLDGAIQLDQEHGALALNDTSLTLNLPKLFRKPLAITGLSGRLHWWHAYDAWHVASADFALESGDVKTRLALNLGIPDNKSSPFLDLQAQFADGDVKQVWRYLPVSIMDQHLVDWLDNSLVGGRVNKGHVLFQGRLHDFPFTDRPGTFQVDFDAEDTQLKFHNQWPTISANDLNAVFTGRGMSIGVNRGSIFESRLQDVRVAIDRFNLPVLSVAGHFDGKTNDAFRFLVSSPIAPAASSFYQQSKISGSMHGKVSLLMPLSEKAETVQPLDYKGDLALSDSSLSAWNRRLVVDQINGLVKFSRAGIFSRKLHGRFGGKPIQFNVASRGAGERRHLEIAMSGGLVASKIRDSLALGGIEERISGNTNWQGLLSFAGDDPASEGQLKLQIDSDLQGIGLDFPEPLRKAPEAVQKFHLEMGFSKEDQIPIEFSLGNTFNAALQLQAPDDAPVRLAKGALQFSTQPAVLPQTDSLVIGGGISRFPIDEWHAVQNQLAGDKDVTRPGRFGLPIVLDMGYLNVVTSKDAPDSLAEDPRNASLLNGEIRKLVYDGMQLGRFEINTSRQEDGLHIDKIKLAAPRFRLSGEGSWFVRQGQQHTNLLLTMASENVGAMITSLGYKGVIKNAKGRAVLQINWPDSPNHFDMAKLNGTLGVVINDGTISDVEPGAGRFVGLLSLTELPRHLALDFSDFRSGMKFKQILAQFDIVDGDAFTQNLHILSPIALIDIRGRTGLAAHDYDLEVSVAPNVSKTLPVISWLAWGGQVGALTFLMDQLFGSEFNKSISSSYRITGSWEKPDVKVIPKQKPEEQNTK